MPPAIVHETTRDSAIPWRQRSTGGWHTLFLVDPDVELVSSLVCHFEKRGFHVAAATSLAEAKTVFARWRSWTTVISDFHLPDGTGWDFYSWLREQNCTSPFLLTSISPVYAPLSTGMEFVAKPFSLAKLEARVRAAAISR